MEDEVNWPKKNVEQLAKLKILWDETIDELRNELLVLAEKHGVVIVMDNRIPRKDQIYAIVQSALMTGVFNPIPIMEKYNNKLTAIVGDITSSMGGDYFGV